MRCTMFTKSELESLLVNVGKKVKKPISIYMIGGCALSFKGIKDRTKDIDIIVASQEDFDTFDESMRENGFQLMTERETEFYLTALAVYMKEDSRIDVFLKQVGKMLFLTEGMIRRSRKYKTYNKLEVYLVSNEDIFLFKMMTSREGDLADCDKIMQGEIDYNILYNEIVEQSKEEGKRWFFWVYENLCKLENYNSIRSPVKNKVFALVKRYWGEKPSDFMDDVSDKAKHISEKKLLKELMRGKKSLYKLQQ